MPLNKPVLINQIKAAMNKQKDNTGDPDAAINAFAIDLANAIETYVRSGTVQTQVNTIPGQVVQVSPTGTGATISPGTGTGVGNIT